MGAGASCPQEVSKEQVVQALQNKLTALKEEVAKEGIEDTPRGETAKAEVKRLRQVLKSTLEENVSLEKCLEELSKTTPSDSARSSEKSDSEDEGQDNRVACSKCGRRFNPDRIEKHESVCKGVAKKKDQVSNDKKEAAGQEEEQKPAEGDGSEEVPKWKKDREKLKEQLKRDQSAKKTEEGAESSTEAAVPAEGATEGAAEDSQAAPAEKEASATDGEQAN